MNKFLPQAWSRSDSPALPVLAWLLLACLLAFQTAAPQSPVVDPLQAVQQTDGGALALDAVPRHEALSRQQQRLPDDSDDEPGLAPPPAQARAAAPLSGRVIAPQPLVSPARFQAAPLNSRAPPLLV